MSNITLKTNLIKKIGCHPTVETTILTETNGYAHELLRHDSFSNGIRFSDRLRRDAAYYASTQERYDVIEALIDGLRDEYTQEGPAPDWVLEAIKKLSETATIMSGQ